MVSVMFLKVRAPAFNLPTGCPQCLMPFLYMRLAKIAFSATYAYYEPDSEELPVAEYGDRVGFSNECGGVIEFLKQEKLADLDNLLGADEQAEIASLKALLRYLNDALMYELWSKENEKVARDIYMSKIPFPLNRALEWNMRRKCMNQIGMTGGNSTENLTQLYKDAFMAYDALSLKKRSGVKYFISDVPSSLDAALLAHLYFVLKVPLQGSMLKEELLQKHPDLVAYSESLRNEVLSDEGATEPPPPPTPQTSASSASGSGSGSGSAWGSSSASSTSKGKGGEAKRKPTAKEKLFKRRAKQFIAAQAIAVVLYVLALGIQYDMDAEDDHGFDG